MLYNSSNKHPTRPHQTALHPFRRDAPVTSRCTRSEEVQCLRIGCTAAHNKHNCGQLLSARTLHVYFMKATREALHHLGSITPVSEHYTTSELV